MHSVLLHPSEVPANESHAPMARDDTASLATVSKKRVNIFSIKAVYSSMLQTKILLYCKSHLRLSVQARRRQSSRGPIKCHQWVGLYDNRGISGR